VSSSLFANLVRQLLQGQVLSVEELIDTITWKDNSAEPSEFVTALGLLLRAKDIPDARKRFALRSIWRRMLIQDDWGAIQSTAHLTDEQLVAKIRRTALYTTLRTAPSAGLADYILTSSQALEAVQPSEIESRWPGLSAKDMAGLEEDFAWEQDYLESFDIHALYGGIVLREQEDREKMED